MSRRGLVVSIIVTSFLTLAVSRFTRAQNKQTQTPEDKPRKVKTEPDKVLIEWPRKDVSLIITADELRAYNKLHTNEERENFIDNFWRNRDPSPDTEENEYKEAYYERIAYANEHFASGKPGWLTDRGRIYIRWGKPDSVESHPAGGTYNRESSEGGGSTTVYPFEKWFYRYLPNVRNGAEIEFVDPTGTGEYRLARNPDEKDALLNIPGAGQTLDEMLGLSTKADRVANVGGFGMVNYRRQQDSPFDALDLRRGLETPPPIKSNDPDGISIPSPKIDPDALDFVVQVAYFRLLDGRVNTAFTIQTDNKDLVFKESGGLPTAKLNIVGRLTTVAEHRVGGFEDTVTTSATAAELSDAKERKSVYGKAVALFPGVYRLDVLVRDVASGSTGTKRVGFTVPKYDPQQIAASTIVLATRLESLKGQPAFGPFVIGQTKVIPNISGIYHRGDPMGVYLQVYNSGIDQTTLRPSVEVEYALLKDGKEVGKQREDWRDMGNTSERLTLARLIDTRALVPGEYEIQVRIRDLVSGQQLSPSAKFSVVR